jgi:hypothetical protein
MTSVHLEYDEIWEDEGGRYLFHYTEARLAQQIAEDEVFEVGGGANFGPGLYATDLRPEEASPEEIRAVCFAGDAAENALNGLLVLLEDDPLTPFEEVEGEKRIFRLPVEEVGEIIPIESILVGVGRRLADGSWEILAWP